MDINYIGLFIATYIFLLTPGVGVALLLSRSVTAGFWISLLMGTGMILGDMTYATFVLTAFSSVSDIIKPYLWYVRIFGVAYLFYIGIQQFRKKSITIDKTKSKASYAKEFGLGYIISFSNPKVIAFYIGFFPQFLPFENLGLYTILTVIATVFSASFLGLLTILWVANKLSKLLTEDKTASLVNRTLGLLIMILALLLLQ